MILGGDADHDSLPSVKHFFGANLPPRMPPKVADLPREVLEPALTSAGRTAQDIRRLLRSDARRDLDSRNSQVVFLWEFSQSDGTIRFDTSDIAKIFNIQDHHASSIRHKGHLKKKPPFRQPTLDSHQEGNVVHFIQHGFASGNYVIQREGLNYVNKILTSGWLQTFLDRPRSQVTTAIVHPQEHVRLQVPRCWLDSYVQLIKNHVPKIPAELKVNIDETGLSYWEERKEKMVLLPSAHTDSTFHHTVNRSVKHHTLMCCISAAGDA
jgi:hypothetical protein